jgi:hypothetical protein
MLRYPGFKTQGSIDTYSDTIHTTTSDTAVMDHYSPDQKFWVSCINSELLFHMRDTLVFHIAAGYYDMYPNIQSTIDYHVFHKEDTLLPSTGPYIISHVNTSERGHYYNNKIQKPLTMIYYTQNTAAGWSYLFSQYFAGIKNNPSPALGVNDTIVVQECLLEYAP